MMRSHALVVLALIAVVFTAHPSAQNAGGSGFVAGQILVKFRAGTPASSQAEAHRQGGGTRVAEIARSRIQLVAVTAGDERGAIARYLRNPNVEYAEPNFLRSVGTPATASSIAELIPADSSFRQQWALHNTGQQFYCIPWLEGELCFYVGTPDADIDAPEAWALSTGSSVKVAVIDTGIDYTHPDLAARYAGGYDFLNGDADPFDDHGHGTHVSGTIAAEMNNLTGDPTPAAEGVVGIAPNARILAYKVCGPDGHCSDFAISQAIDRAITDGARVINMSLGDVAYSQSLDDSVQIAWAAGLVIVAGAGNNGTTDLFYPAALENVVSVGASDEDDLRASFSNYGNWVDIAAPGNVILSTYLMSQCSVSTTPGDTGCYAFNSGTSMATPHVSGAAALVWSRSDITSNWQVVDAITHGADANGVSSVPVNSWTFYGRLNLYGAMTWAAGPPPPPNTPPVANAGTDVTLTDGNDGDGGVLVTLNGGASSDPDGDALSYEWREGATIIGSGPQPSVFFLVGVHTVTLTVTDGRGGSSTDTVIVTINAAPPPNTAPVANAGTDVTATDSDGDGSATVMLNGTGSSDPDGDPLTYQWREGVSVLATGPTPSVVFAVGVHTVSLDVTDGRGGSSTDTVLVTINAPPPVPTLSVTGISPNVVNQKAGTVTFVITGTGFAAGASVSFVNGSGPAPRVLSVTRDSSTQLTARVEIRSGGPKTTRRWDVLVTNPGGTSATGAGLLTITP